MKHAKKISSIFITLFMLFVLMAGSVYASGGIKIVIDSKEVQSDVAPVVDEGRTLVPLRVISESLGANVEWVQSA